jgi:DNA-binding FrmR family transcriptional regulator
LVEHLEGSPRAKQRLEVILDTIAGRLTIDEACRPLGIKPAMFNRLRTEVLEVGLACLEPRPLGRPPHQATEDERRCADLERQVVALESELKIAAVREEIARLMPHLMENDVAEKKTTHPSSSTSPQSHNKRRKKHHRPNR